MRIIIAIIAGIVAGLGVRMLTSPAVKEITEPAPSYTESHAETVRIAEMKAAAKPERDPPLNPAYTEPLSVRGYVVRGQKVNVCLSDGTTWTEKTGGLETVERSHVVFRAKLYAIRGAGAALDRPQAVARTELPPPTTPEVSAEAGQPPTPINEIAPQQQSAFVPIPHYTPQRKTSVQVKPVTSR